MLSLFLAAATGHAWATAERVTVELVPTDDVWVYPHASDPSKDAYLRTWGVDGLSVYPGETGDASYSYLKFETASLPVGKIVSATLNLTSVADPVWSLELSKYAPLEVRALGFDFDESTWKFNQVQSIAPKQDKSTVFSSVSATKIEKGKPVPFALSFNSAGLEALEKARPKFMTVALTTKMDPAQSGQGSMYKLYSKDAEDPAKRPRLIVVIER